MTGWHAGAHRFPVGGRVSVMGILNVTPDSFSDGGRFADPDAAVRHGLRLVEEGADILDVGGESTRPGAAPVAAEEESRRVVPVIRALTEGSGIPVSIDSMKANVAEAAVEAGACIVNDVTAGLHDPRILEVAAESGAGLVLMHMQGTPRTMQTKPAYADVVAEVRGFLAERAETAMAAGVPRERIALDPGFGFGKTLEHNLDLLRGLPELKALGFPVLVGLSRKSFVGTLTASRGEGAPAPADRVEGSLAAATLAVAGGADVVRVHDVRAHSRAMRVAEAVLARGGG